MTEIRLKIVGLAALMLAVFGLSACNTMAGLGEDVEAAGEGLQQETQ